MAGILGILNLDGAPVDPAILDRMTGALRHRGPDGVGRYVAANVGLVHLRFHTTPGAAAEGQPLRSADGEAVLVMDGRLDNRDDLLRELGADGGPAGSTDSDPALVLRAYQRWGTAFAARLIGDFAIVLWDAPRRRLVAVRDVFGMRPLHHALFGSTFVWASELAALLAHPGLRRIPNEGMVGEILANRICSITETLWQGISRLAPAHHLIVANGVVSTGCYWQPDFTRQIRYRKESDYADHFRSLFETVLGAYLRSSGDVGLYLSGGFDSSSVLGMLDHMRRVGRRRVPQVEIGSLVFPGLQCDERPHIEATARHFGATAHLHDATVLEQFSYLDYARQRLDFPGYPNGVMLAPIRQQFAQQGIRVTLTGLGGDDWFETTGYAFADAVVAANPLLFAQVFATQATWMGLRHTLGRAPKVAIEPWMPPWLERALRLALARPLVPSWMDPDFARRISLEDRIGAARFVRRPGALDGQALIAQSSGPESLHCMEAADLLCAGQRDERHPFCDRRIVDFAIALPLGQRRRGRQSRIVVRNAMRGILPERARARSSTAEYTPAVHARLKETLATDLPGVRLDDFHVVGNGWVRRAGLAAHHDACYNQSSARGHSSVWPLWMATAIEIWLRATG